MIYIVVDIVILCGTWKKKGKYLKKNIRKVKKRKEEEDIFPNDHKIFKNMLRNDLKHYICYGHLKKMI